MTAPRDFLSHLNSSVIRLGLDPIKKLLASLNNPHHNFRSVLIGGTNGKGSIAATTAAILRAGGLRTGLYTSPHLVDLRERIRIDEAMITGEALDDLIDEVRGRVREEVTYFEFLTAVAFLHFSRMHVDVAVLEVGLGGRLDATNVVEPLLSVISNISLEHQEYLGTRLADIAREKAGIIREGGVCITAAKQTVVRGVLAETCRQRRAVLYRLGKDITVRRNKDGTFSYQGLKKNYSGLPCSLVGRHQIENAALALATTELLAARGLVISDEAVSRGMKSTQWEGRLEVLQSAPLVVLDGGHNAAGITVLTRALKQDFTYRRLILVFGVLRDKNYQQMLKKLAPLAQKIIITRPDSERAVPPDEVRIWAKPYCDQVEVVEEPGQALNSALAAADREDLVCVAGSLYLIGAIKKAHALSQASS